MVTLQGQIIEQSGTMTDGGNRVTKGRMGSSVIMEVSKEQVNKMELELQKDYLKVTQIQEQNVQLDEAVLKLRPSEREMRNKPEKFTASIQHLSEKENICMYKLKNLKLM